MSSSISFFEYRVTGNLCDAECLKPHRIFSLSLCISLSISHTNTDTHSKSGVGDVMHIFQQSVCRQSPTVCPHGNMWTCMNRDGVHNHTTYKTTGLVLNTPHSTHASCTCPGRCKGNQICACVQRMQAACASRLGVHDLHLVVREQCTHRALDACFRLDPVNENNTCFFSCKTLFSRETV